MAIGYPDETTAEAARGTVQQLEADLIIQADEVAAISRDAKGKYHVHTSHSAASAAGGAVWGGFWGLLFGLLFFIPFAGWAVGAGFGALFGHFGENAIDKTFQDQVVASPPSFSSCSNVPNDMQKRPPFANEVPQLFQNQTSCLAASMPSARIS